MRLKKKTVKKCKSLELDIAKKQRIDEEEEELKRHLQIAANDDDVYTKATILALKVPIVDYQIHHENNKPYYKIIRADVTHKLFLSFITLLRNFNQKDLETLWKLVKEIFESTEPKNFSDDFLLNILKIMFEKPNVEANVWKEQKGRYGLAKKYPLTRFTLEQMLNNVRLEVKEESKTSLELLNISPTRYYKDDACWSAYLKSKTIEDIISIESFVEVLVLNQYVLVRNILALYKEALRKRDQMYQTFRRSSLAMTHKLDDMIELPESQPKKIYKEDLECEMVRVKIPRCMSFLGSTNAYDEPIGSLEENLGTPMEEEPLDQTKLEDVGLDTLIMKFLLALRCPSLDEILGDERGLEPPIKSHSLDSFKIKVVDNLAIHTSPSPHVASFHPKDPKDVYCYYHPCIDDPKKHYDFKLGLLGSLTKSFSNSEVMKDDFLREGLSLPIKTKELKKG
uniref:Uncharacterized protein n=1 Tax=Tanacetum cinerariifolium TaxID=118510 RepID=A0A6L2JWN7_TANCI|nr:hypothetical protein [Tanacetum cinerariifolium]